MKSLLRFVAPFLLLLTATSLHAESSIVIKSGDTIGFMGDSITAQANSPSGYIGLTMYALKVEGVDAKSIPAGVPGHTSGNMRSRVEPQVLSAKANWMTLSCGVNDVMMQAKGHGVDLETFKKNVTSMVEACAAKNCKVVVMTPTPLGEDPTNASNKQLAGYVEFMKSYGKETGLLVADVNAAFLAQLKMPAKPGEKEGARLLADGIHPNQVGQALMAKTLILTLGIPEADLPKVEKAWFENPRGKAVKIGQGSFVLISQKQFKAIEEQGGKHANVGSVISGLWKKALDESNNDAAAAQTKIGAMVDDYISNGGKAE